MYYSPFIRDDFKGIPYLRKKKDQVQIQQMNMCLASNNWSFCDPAVLIEPVELLFFAHFCSWTLVLNSRGSGRCCQLLKQQPHKILTFNETYFVLQERHGDLLTLLYHRQEVMMMEFFNRTTCNSVSHTHPIMIICQLPLVWLPVKSLLVAWSLLKNSGFWFCSCYFNNRMCAMIEGVKTQSKKRYGEFLRYVHCTSGPAYYRPYIKNDGWLFAVLSNLGMFLLQQQEIRFPFF